MCLQIIYIWYICIKRIWQMLKFLIRLKTKPNQTKPIPTKTSLAKNYNIQVANDKPQTTTQCGDKWHSTDHLKWRNFQINTGLLVKTGLRILASTISLPKIICNYFNHHYILVPLFLKNRFHFTLMTYQYRFSFWNKPYEETCLGSAVSFSVNYFWRYFFLE